MKKRISYYLKLAALAAVFFVVADMEVSAQGLSLFQSQGGGNDKKRSGKVPTVINSDVMDIDVSKNIAVFTDNVKVDDEEMTITCRKMTIFFEDKKTDDKKEAVKKPADGDAGKPSEESKQISRIICEENVVIVRKPSNDGEMAQGEQKALAGHADYDVKTGKIILTKDPVIMRDEDTLKGEVIIIFRDSEKIEVHRGGEIRLGSDTVNNMPKENDEKKSPEKKDDDAGREIDDNAQKTK
ncbi:MAG: LptA/OstA family protein [Victivallales bacterium]